MTPQELCDLIEKSPTADFRELLHFIGLMMEEGNLPQSEVERYYNKYWSKDRPGGLYD